MIQGNTVRALRLSAPLLLILLSTVSPATAAVYPPDRDRLTEDAIAGWYNITRDRIVRSTDAVVGRYAVQATQQRSAKGTAYLAFPRPRDLGLDLSRGGRVVFHYKCPFECTFGLQTRDRWLMFWRTLPASPKWRKVSFEVGTDKGWRKAGKPQWAHINGIYYSFAGPRGSKLLLDGLHFGGEVRGERVARALTESAATARVEKVSVTNVQSATVFFDVIGRYGGGGTRVLLNEVEVGALPSNRFGVRFWLRRCAVTAPKSRLAALLVTPDGAMATRAGAKEVALADTIPPARVSLRNITCQGFRVSNVFVELRFRDGRRIRSEIAQGRFGNVSHWDHKRRPVFRTKTSHKDPVNLPALAFPKGGAEPASPGGGKGASWGCEITKLKNLFLDTPLALNGRPACCIASPQGPKYAELATMIQRSILKASGVTTPVKTADKITDADFRGTNLILLGDLASNRAIGRLVFDAFIACQSGGPEGHVVQTIHNPFGYGRNVIFLGGANPEETRRSVRAFLPFIKPGKSVSVSHIRLIGMSKTPERHGPEFQRVYKRFVRQMRKKPKISVRDFVLLMRRTHVAGQRFNRTGSPGWLAVFKAGIETCMRYTATTETQAALFPDTGLCGDPNSTRGYLVRSWDLVEEEPVFTDQDRLRITNWLLRLKADPFSGLTPFHLESGPDIVRNFWNHVTGPAMDFFWASHYFLKYYDLTDAKEWDRVAYRFMGEQSKSWRGNENACGYNARTQRHILEYALAKPDLTYFSSGNAHKMAEQILMVTDNLGISARFGSSGPPWRANSYVDQLNKIAWFYRDGRYLSLHPAIGRIYGFDGTGPQWGVKPREPRQLIGVKALPLGKDLYNWVKRTGGAITAATAATKSRKRFIPVQKAFDKLTFRAGFDPQDQYMVIDGFARGQHGDFTGNAILQMSANGRVFLASKDTGYGNASPNKFNAVTIIKDGEAAIPPPFTGLEHIADFARTGFSQTLTLDYAGVDWYRNVIWAKERYFVVIDRLCAREGGSYCFRTFWRTPGDQSELQGSTLRSAQQGERFCIQNLDGSDCVRKLVPQPAWGPARRAKKGYVFAKPVFTELTQMKAARLKPGQAYAVINLLCAASDKAPRSFEARKLGPSAALVKGAGSYACVGVGHAFRPRGLTVKAALSYVGSDVIALVAGSLLKCQETTVFRSDRPISVELDLRSGKCQVETQAPAIVHIRGITDAAEVTLNGQPARPSHGKLRVPAGRHTITSPAPRGLPKLSKELSSAFSALYSSLPKASPLATKEPPLKSLAVLRRSLLRGRAQCVAVMNMGRRGRFVAAGASNGQVVCLGADGKAKWTRKVSGPVLCLAAADITGDGSDDLLVGADELSLLDRDGNVVWAFRAPGDAPAAKRSVCAVYAADVEDDGSQEVFVGTRRAGSFLLNAKGKTVFKLAAPGQAQHIEPVKFALADTDGDGVKELFRATTWNSIHVNELVPRNGGYAYGRHKWWQRLLTGAHDILVEDLDSNGKKEIVFADGNLYIYYYPNHVGFNRGVEKSLGDAATALCSADLDRDGAREIVVGARTGYVCAFRKTGQGVWHTHVGGPVATLAAGDLNGDSIPEVVVARADRNVYVLDSDGRKTAVFAFPSAVLDMQLADVAKAPGAEVVAACADGAVYILKPR